MKKDLVEIGLLALLVSVAVILTLIIFNDHLSADSRGMQPSPEMTEARPAADWQGMLSPVEVVEDWMLADPQEAQSPHDLADDPPSAGLQEAYPASQATDDPPAAESQVVQSVPGKSQEQPAAPATFDMQTSNAGGVTVNITPLNWGGDTWNFEAAFNTHSVNLDFDVTIISSLRCDQGLEFLAVAWDGPGSGGHHRFGTLKFPALDHPTSFVEIAIRDVAEAPERIFHWDISMGDDSRPGDRPET